MAHKTRVSSTGLTKSQAKLLQSIAKGVMKSQAQLDCIELASLLSSGALKKEGEIYKITSDGRQALRR